MNGIQFTICLSSGIPVNSKLKTAIKLAFLSSLD